MVARADGDGFAGRTTYWDGNPRVMGARLLELAQERFGGDIEAMLKVLIDEHGGWSVIRPGLDAAYLAEHKMGLPEQSVLVEGIGIAYTDMDGEEVLRGRSGEEMPAMGVEWVYAFKVETGEMEVYEVKRKRGEREVPAKVGQVAVGDFDVDWEAIECGERLERCRHAVYVHAERFGIDLGHASARLGVKQFLGEEELTDWSAIGAVYNGKRYTFTGNGRREADGRFYDEAMVDGVKTKLDKHASGVKLIYPKLRDEMLKSGELKIWPAAEQAEAAVSL